MGGESCTVLRLRLMRKLAMCLMLFFTFRDYKIDYCDMKKDNCAFLKNTFFFLTSDIARPHPSPLFWDNVQKFPDFVLKCHP